MQSIACDDPSSPVGDVWGGGPQLTMEGVDIFDPTLPEGQSWNANRNAVRGRGLAEDYGFEELVVGPEPGHTVPASDDATSSLTQVPVLIYVPDFVPEILEVSIALPAAIEGLKAQVQNLRAPEQSFSFPELYPVSPQPLREIAIFTAGPTWQTYTVIVLFDCRRCNDCIFAQVVPTTLSRESLLLAAGFPPDDPVHVFVHGLIRPLAIDQRITLVHGMTVSISPRSEGSPAQYDLAEMLLASDDWDSDAPMPGPTVHFNSHLYILTEGTPFAFQVQPGRQATFREDVARTTGTAEYRLSLGTVTPRITDAYPYGFWTSAVLVATDALQRVPCPPARTPERRSILVLDQRRILRGITWRFVFSRVQKVQDLADLYYDMCPPRHVVSLDGARVELRDGVQVFIVQPGQVLTVEFVPEKPSPPPSDHEHGATSLLMRDGSPTDHHASDVSAGPHHGHAGSLSQNDSTRSRSPRGRSQPEAHHSRGMRTVPWQGKLTKKTPQERANALHKMADVLHDSKCKRTLWVPTTGPARAAPVEATFHFVSGVPTTVCKLLQELSTTVTCHPAFEAARGATRRLGGEWPFPPYRWPIDLPALEDDDMSDIVVGEGRMTDIVVVLLTPDYAHERLDLTVELPQTVEEVIDLVQTCRDAEHRRLFPALIEVRQQPDAGWGLFLAVPLWLRQRAVVCVDSSLYDGRVFAISVSTNTDRYMLCELAGLAPMAEVDVFVPGHDEPLPPGADCQVSTGMCIVFVQPGRGRPPAFQLSETLRSCAFWEHSPMFPQDSLGNGYCVAGPTGQQLFRLHPERAFFYRADIALLADLHPLRVVVTPSEPQQVNTSVRGWLCRTVVSATDRDDQFIWDGTTISAIPGLLDCRPLMMGWLPVSARAHWLDLEPIRSALNQSAPPGWCVCFPDLPAHWTWVCFHAGKVIKVAFEEHPGPLFADTTAATGRSVQDRLSDSDQLWSSEAGQDSATATATFTLPRDDNTRVSQQRLDRRGHRPTPWHVAVAMCLAGALSLIISYGELQISAVACAVILSHYPLSGAFCLAGTLTQVESMQHAALHHAPGMPPDRRPLPTPVRAGMTTDRHVVNRKVPSHDALVATVPWDECNAVLEADLMHLTTLLEESLAAPGSQALFLAATLLETLFEHATVQFNKDAVAHQQVHCISLVDCVSSPAFSLDVESVKLPHSQDLLRLLYQPWPAD